MDLNKNLQRLMIKQQQQQNKTMCEMMRIEREEMRKENICKNQ